ncbi:hypothetical protein MC7420_7426 [Coleofasciculus chthonoplastes PCC 7420]|uniref:KOW domain-containing protein n=1 Tax=Coleofasciculus chthonoplastes PCC 7420 TaxID=118168 RepID=B4VHJ9_9CYAN|nr:hypothetical protein [Coleofasciculus chthonoplastes]EDX78773.1 hypothetical protein MC7420_7426 [Coleofasciculus chthonoplastes PCC 7420]
MVYQQNDRVKIIKGSLKGHTGKIASCSHEGSYFIARDLTHQTNDMSNLYGPLLGDEISPLSY